MKSEKFLLSVITPIATGLIILFGCVLYANHQANKLTCVDGDTFAIGSEYFRMSYIDTPEKGEIGYKRASDYTCQYLQGFQKSGGLKLVRHGQDIYGRTLVEVLMPTFHGPITLNEDLIKMCYAKPFYKNTTDKILSIYNRVCEYANQNREEK